MSKLLPIHAGTYTGLLAWLRDTLPGLPTTNASVWSVFRQFTELDEAAARRVITYDTDPIVFVETLDGIDGYFDPDRPRAITIGQHIAGNGTVPDVRQLERTVLHELVHWTWAAAKRVETREEGVAFERAAYPGLAAATVAELAVPETGAELGMLSRRWESRGNPGAIGFDTTGGWSYGLYQLASRQGSVAAFIGFLDRTPAWQPFAQRLRSAGGDAEAREGSQRFFQAWKALAPDAAFAQAQHDFIRAMHYEPFVSTLAGKGIEIRNRSLALRDVAWSVAVQHGLGGTIIFVRAWTPLAPLARSDDASFITAIYTERRRVDVYFKSSSAKVREAVLQRFEDEQLAALNMLKRA